MGFLRSFSQARVTSDLQFLFVLIGQLFHGLIPEGGFDMIAQFGILAEVLIVERQRIAETLPDGRREGIITPLHSQPRA